MLHDLEKLVLDESHSLLKSSTVQDFAFVLDNVSRQMLELISDVKKQLVRIYSSKENVNIIGSF